MKFREWIKEPVSVNNIICDCTDPSGFDADNTIYPLGCAKQFRQFVNKNSLCLNSTHFYSQYNNACPTKLESSAIQLAVPPNGSTIKKRFST